MIKPVIVSPDEDVYIVTKIFDAPLVTKGWTWLPLTEIIVLGIIIRETGTRLGVAALTMLVILGSEWCHNLAHAAAAKMVGHPVDCIRITWGMPLLVYHDIEDADVAPQAHIVRALGGPIINTIFFVTAVFLRRLTKPKSTARDVVNAALGMNAFLVLGGMLPIPGIDGGAVLKWALVDKGQTSKQADEIIRKIDIVTAAELGVGAALAFKKRKHWLGGIFAMFAAFALAIGTGLLREKS